MYVSVELVVGFVWAVFGQAEFLMGFIYFSGLYCL